MFRRLLARAARSDRGNVLMITGFSLLPLTFAAGMGIDYARAMKAQTKLNAIADAAALTAVSKPAMAITDDLAGATALQMFSLQASALVAAKTVTITSLNASAVTDNNGKRTAVVSYTADSPNSFAGILGSPVLHIRGTSTTTNALAPDIDFYMLLDVSASMALPTTTAGLSQVAASNSKKCEFACHSQNDTKGTAKDGSTTDLYGVAKSYGLTLRIDEEGTATSKLTADAQSTASKNGATYQMAIATFRGAGGFSVLQPLTPDLNTAATKTTGLTPFNYYKNSCPTSACKSSEIGYNDQDTGSSDAFDQMNALIPTPSTGVKGNRPQAVMFVVTDGMRDEQRPGGRPEVAFDTNKCATLKQRGIRIAILYTEYLPESMTGDSWSQTNVAPYLYKVEPALQACASPGLYTKVSTNDDIYTALDNLFQSAVATARITN
ncbi:TadE/TadG family type IV pilus assembly protein [Sphingomonas morindae]|uniref:Pilus assembly protein TadG-related protein n=1 Tax=Sphingomonas morindae TaxID=1541170 RepID=A0ABY4X5W3_9SPHN|nr:pilus assembly protein TadG-related protein [Sphingomonas morindae]USI72210.1 pilus assembly protein TadG-related protein [Sphingomonas morindae]